MADERSEDLPPELADLPDVLTLADLAAFLRLDNLDTARDLLRSGAIPGGWKAGREWRILRSALAAYVQGRADGDPGAALPPA